MSENKKVHLGLLGEPYQYKLLGELMIANNINEDTKNIFFDEVIDLLDPKYFEFLEMRRIMVMIKEYYQKNKISPNMDNIESMISSTINNEMEQKECQARINSIKAYWKDIKTGRISNDRNFIKSQTLTFVKQQEFIALNKESQVALESGVVSADQLLKISEKYKKLIDIGSPMNFGTDIFDKPDNLLVKDFRTPIGTGIKEIDEKIGGGLTNGEWALILAGSGVGKTPFLTLIANNAYLNGYNVLHIILEGKKDDVRRAHYSKIFKIPTKDFYLHKEEMLSGIKKMVGDPKIGNMKVERLSDETTPNKLKKWVCKTEEKLGYKFDVICLDYIDCMRPEERYSSPFFGQEEVARKMESITEEMGWRVFAGIQAKKEAIDKRVLDMADCGGSVERLKKAQLVISLGADKQQKTTDKINIAINKCRFARSGWVWEDCTLDNSILEFSVNTHVNLNPDITETAILANEYATKTAPNHHNKGTVYVNDNSKVNRDKLKDVQV